MSVAAHQVSSTGLSVNVAVITCSDTRTKQRDTSGAYIRDCVERAGHRVVDYSLIEDSPVEIRKLILAHTESDTDVILVSGGTGISKRDNTFAAIQEMLQTPIPGFGELFRKLSFDQIGAASMLSRAEAGIIGSTLIFSMPGSRGAVQLAMQSLIIPQIGHMVSEIRK